MAKHLRGLSIGLSLLALSVVVMVGCSSKTPVAIQYDQAVSLDAVTPRALEAVAVALEVSQVILPSVADSIVISKDNIRHTFKVDAGALTAATEIDVKSYEKNLDGGKAVVFEFGPDGLVFSKAAELNFDVNALGAKTVVNLYYYDPKVGGWVLQGTARVNDGHATFKIYHFSKYAIG